MASRAFSLLSLTASGIAALLVALTPATPAMADEDPYYRAPRVRAAPAPRMRVAPAPQRVIRPVVSTRTVWRPRNVCFDYSGNPVDCRTPVIIGYTYSCGGCAPVAPPVQYYAPPVAAPCAPCAPAAVLPPPRYYGTGCGDCAPAPHYVHGHGRYRHHGHPIRAYGYAAQ